MQLTQDQIKDKLKKPSNSNIEVWKKEHNSLDIYVNGGDVSSELEQVKNYENKDQKQLREKIARSTKDLMGYIFKPLSKVFTATGYNVEIESENDTVKKQMLEYLDKLPEGISLKKWMQTYWLDPYSTDPNGVILVETDGEKAYPTYKSINVVHDYEYKWGKFEYLILDAGKMKVANEDVKVYRVYDDVHDSLYYVKDNQLVEIEGERFDNTIGQVPAVVVSDIVDKKTGGRRSFIHSITELLKEYMRDSSVHSIYKFLHGFPIFWSYAMKCTTCEGEGVVENESYVQGAEGINGEKTRNCPSCHGKRLKVTSDVSDGIRLPIPQSSDDPKLAPNIAGYIQPDLATWKQQLSEMSDMGRNMHFSVWGTHVEDEKSNTATGRYIDAQPVNDTLRNVSDTVEQKESDIILFIGKLMYKDQFIGGKSTYGKRFMVETPDVLWEKYIEAKNLKAPISALDHLYKQFLSGEYYGDSKMFEQKMKEFFLEPFPHHSVSDLKGVATHGQLQKKILFSDWINMEVDFRKDLKTLMAEFEEFVKLNRDDKITGVQSASPEGEVVGQAAQGES